MYPHRTVAIYHSLTFGATGGAGASGGSAIHCGPSPGVAPGRPLTRNLFSLACDRQVARDGRLPAGGPQS